MPLVTLVLLSSLVSLPSCSGSQAPSPTPSQQETVAPAAVPSDRDVLIGRARSLLARGEFEASIEVLKEVDRILVFEQPTYEHLFELGQALCATGRADLGREALATYVCGREVDAGLLQCGPTLEESDPRITPDCHNRMCPELYWPYYDVHTADEVANLIEAAQQGKEALAGCPP